jgi:hypothetical protein
MIIGRRIKQSEMAARSTARLTGILLAVSISLLLFKVLPLAKICGSLTLFFTLVTAGEYWNVRRLKKLRAREAHEKK